MGPTICAQLPNTLDRGPFAAARLILPSGTLATGVTGLRLFGVDVGTAAPMRFITTHPRQIRRPGLQVTRVSVLYKAFRILIEYEGDQHRTDKTQWKPTSTDMRTSSATVGRSTA